MSPSRAVGCGVAMRWNRLSDRYQRPNQKVVSLGPRQQEGSIAGSSSDAKMPPRAAATGDGGVTQGSHPRGKKRPRRDEAQRAVDCPSDEEEQIASNPSPGMGAQVNLCRLQKNTAPPGRSKARK